MSLCTSCGSQAHSSHQKQAGPRIRFRGTTRLPSRNDGPSRRCGCPLKTFHNQVALTSRRSKIFLATRSPAWYILLRLLPRHRALLKTKKRPNTGFLVRCRPRVSWRCYGLYSMAPRRLFQPLNSLLEPPFAPLLANAATQPTSGASHTRAGVEPASIFGNRPNFPPGALTAGIIATQWSKGRTGACGNIMGGSLKTSIAVEPSAASATTRIEKLRS